MSKYKNINREKLSSKGQDFYDKFSKATKGFTDEKAVAKYKVGLDKFYDKIASQKPEAITATTKPKSVSKPKVKKKKAESKPKKKGSTQSKAKKKSLPKKKREDYKNANMGQYAKLATRIAKKEGISYREAQKKASKTFTALKEAKKLKKADKFESMVSHLRKKVEYKGGRGIDRTGEDKESGSKKKIPRGLEKDAKLSAKPFGKRKSKFGNTYYEYRDNRADAKQPQPSEYPRLAKGGKIMSFREVLDDRSEGGGREIVDNIEELEAYGEPSDATQKEINYLIDELEKKTGYRASKFAFGGDITQNFDVRSPLGTYAKGGEVYFHDTKSSKVQSWENRKSKSGKKSFGAFAHKLNNKYLGDYYLYELDDFDKEMYSHIKLKDGEVLARTETDNMVGGESPLIKINLKNGRVYFMSDSSDEKNPKFDRASVDVIFISLDKKMDKYADGGMVDSDDDSSYTIIAMHEQGGGYVMSKPSTKEMAEKLLKATNPPIDTNLKIVSVSDAKKMKYLIGDEVLMAKGGKTKKFSDYLQSDSGEIYLEWYESSIKDSRGFYDDGTLQFKEFKTIEDAEKFYKNNLDLNYTKSYAKGGEVDTKVSSLKKGDTIKIKFGSVVSRDNNVTLKVRSRNKVRKGTIDKITFENVNNPKGNKFYAYERGDGIFRFAMGDMAISNIELIDYYDKGGKLSKKVKSIRKEFVGVNNKLRGVKSDLENASYKDDKAYNLSRSAADAAYVGTQYQNKLNNLEDDMIEKGYAKGGKVDYRGTITNDVVEDIINDKGFNVQFNETEIDGLLIYGQKEELNKVKSLLNEYNIKTEFRDKQGFGLHILKVPSQIIDYAKGGVLTSEKLGTAYKLDGNTLLFTPLSQDGTYDNDDWGEIDFDLLDEDLVNDIKKETKSLYAIGGILLGTYVGYKVGQTQDKKSSKELFSTEKSLVKKAKDKVKKAKKYSEEGFDMKEKYTFGGDITQNFDVAAPYGTYAKGGDVRDEGNFAKTEDERIGKISKVDGLKYTLKFKDGKLPYKKEYHQSKLTFSDSKHYAKGGNVKPSDKYGSPYVLGTQETKVLDTFSSNPMKDGKVFINTLVEAKNSDGELYYNHRVYNPFTNTTEYLGQYRSKGESIDGFNSYKPLDDSYAKGGNAGRDAKFLSEQKHEQDYKLKRKLPYKRYKK